MQGSIQRTADERLATSRMSRQGEPTVDEYAPPVMPDPQVSSSCYCRCLHSLRGRRDEFFFLFYRSQMSIHCASISNNDVQELVEDVKDAASAAREDVKKALDGKKI